MILLLEKYLCEFLDFQKSHPIGLRNRNAMTTATNGQKNATYVEFRSISNNVSVSNEDQCEVSRVEREFSEIEDDPNRRISVVGRGGVTTPIVKPINMERPLLLSIINTAIRNSFVFTFIAMMVGFSFNFLFYAQSFDPRVLILSAGTFLE